MTNACSKVQNPHANSGDPACDPIGTADRGHGMPINKRKILQLAKGFRGRAKNCNRIARERVEKGLQYAYRDRRQKKRDFRSLWIQRINAGAREYGVSTTLSTAGWLLFLLHGLPLQVEAPRIDEQEHVVVAGIIFPIHGWLEAG